MNKYYSWDTHIYKIWSNIRQRCNNPKATGFECYGGKGIIICEEWDSFENFKDWSLDNGYQENLVLSRKDSNDDYYPGNCEWITDDQHRDKRGKICEIITIEYQGEEITLSKLSKITGVHRETLKYRWLRGKRGEELVRKPDNGFKLAV